ncbi:DNA translocase FtsK [Lyngbya aestuarii]|uniref:DNA translocase FtsK n=1 Tax=Lyngbya aestuarii TaxID=118322 RepID=UPI00403DBB65
MPYLTKAADIQSIITKLASAKTIWADTEVADWDTSNPKLSLIQVLADPTDVTGDHTYVLDVLNKPDLVTDFVNQIMANPHIEKIFHNASYDLRYLGGNQQAQNVTCTYKMVNKLTKKSNPNPLEVSSKKLKTLAVELCQFSGVDTAEQASNWKRRPLSEKQIKYAKMDTVYLAHVHRRLLELTNKRQVQNFQPIPFNVTNVRVAFECPRLFYLGHHDGCKTMFLPPGKSPGIGTAFHNLSEQFVRVAQQEPQFFTLFKPPFEQLKVETIAAQMQELFYNLAFFPYLQAATQKDPGKAPALYQLWQGIIGLIHRWADLLVRNRRYCSAEDVIRKTFIAQELNVEHYFPLTDGTEQLVRGRFDSLVYDFENHRLCVVEYKTYESPDKSAQLAQVALYGYMLREKIGVPIDSAVYSVLPGWQELTFSWDDLEKTVHQIIPQKLQQMRQWISWEPSQPNPPPPTSQPELLCDICPQRNKCKTFFVLEEQQSQPTVSPSNSQVSLPADKVAELPQQKPEPQTTNNHKTAQAQTPDADATGEQLVSTLQSFGIGVDYQGAAVGPAFIRVKLKPHLGVKVSSLLRLSADLQVQMGIANPPLIAPQAGYVSVDLPRQDRQVAKFEHYIQSQTIPPNAPVRIAIGVDLDGKLVEADLSDPNTCHFLVGGTTGSGKSEFLRSLLLSLLWRHSPEHLKIALVDPKRVTFPEFEQIPWLLSPVVKDSENAIALMTELVGEMERRYQLFEASGCPHLDAYNQQKTQQKKPLLSRIVCIFDEYADFMAEKDSRKSLELSIKRLGAMARAAGIHLIIATQRPEASIVTPIIRSNLPGRVALRTASEADSAIVLGGRQTEAAYLLGKGDLMYQVGSKLQRLQSLFAQQIQLP